MLIAFDDFLVAQGLRVGDLIFIRARARPFREVAAATGSWTNHVGIVVRHCAHGTWIAESRFPWSRTTRLQRFVARSEDGRVAVARLRAPLDAAQQQRLQQGVRRRLGVLYDTGFNLHSRRQFCSRFVREVLADAAGIEVGEVQSFAQLFAHRPQASLAFWRLWYFGRIPWARETVTPASVLRSPALQITFDGRVTPGFEGPASHRLSAASRRQAAPAAHAESAGSR